MPPSTSPSTWFDGTREAIIQTRTTARIPIENANTGTEKEGRAHSKARAAPNPAPVDVPNTSGDTIGLRKIIWNIRPERDNAAPIRLEANILGSLMLKTTDSACGVQSGVVGMIFEKRIFMSSTGFTGYLPIEKDSMKTRI